MNVEEMADYGQVAILKKYSINSETCRQWFHTMEVLMEETPKELYWVKPAEKTVYKVAETIILEQFLKMLCPELQTWIKEHDPASAEEGVRLNNIQLQTRSSTSFRTPVSEPQPQNRKCKIKGCSQAPPLTSGSVAGVLKLVLLRVCSWIYLVRLADVFVAAWRRTEPWSFAQWKTVRNKSYSHKTSSLLEGGKSMCERLGKQIETSSAGGTIKCYSCGQIGHKKPMCPNLNKKLTNSELQKTYSEIGPIYSRKVENGKQCKEMFFKGSSFYLENELLYRKTGNASQMVLLLKVLTMVMKMGHSIIWAAIICPIKSNPQTFFSGQTKQCSFEVQQQILSMLPTEENKLLGKWQGPFKEWFQQKESASVNLIRVVDDEEEIEGQYLSASQGTSSVNLDHLSWERKRQIEELCDLELFQSTPGCTTLVQH
ncbi:Zinc finger protein 213 [Labeo rohita]|uniref:Zinc finger protein 213 n=1 Tax=Labeo rohita TaxID=84645 RepID=A0ABQ8LZM0_LABRO|nr:Zinc finger protein 213 [Labeo rohita]